MWSGTRPMDVVEEKMPWMNTSKLRKGINSTIKRQIFNEYNISEVIYLHFIYTTIYKRVQIISI